MRSYDVRVLEANRDEIQQYLIRLGLQSYVFLLDEFKEHNIITDELHKYLSDRYVEDCDEAKVSQFVDMLKECDIFQFIIAREFACIENDYSVLYEYITDVLVRRHVRLRRVERPWKRLRLDLNNCLP